MKRLYWLLLCFFVFTGSYAQNFEDYFENKTLRIDYLFSGDAEHQAIYLDELSQLPTWAGRRHQLTEFPLEGDGQILMRDLESKECIYKSTFSSHLDGWIYSDDAKEVAKGFEHTCLLPYPKQPVEVEVTLFNSHREPFLTYKHVVRPDDVLIHPRGTTHVTPHRYLLQNGSEADCIDVAFLAEGYREEEMELFYQDAQIACDALFSHEPFKSLKHKFNMVAVASPSLDSGVSFPSKGVWKETAILSHFDTNHIERLLSSDQTKTIHNLLAGIPYEHIIILANTETYGGGGLYNGFAFTAAHHPAYSSVIVHEFGHSFGGLADEYFSANDALTDTCPLDVEPWSPNVTTLIDFASKWEDMLPPDTPRPTPEDQEENYPVGLYEGGSYSAKGVYRPAVNCRMKSNGYPVFCPVCQRSLQRLIEFYVP